MDGMGWLTIGAIHFAEYNFLIYEIRSDHMAKLGSVCVCDVSQNNHSMPSLDKTFPVVSYIFFRSLFFFCRSILYCTCANYVSSLAIYTIYIQKIESNSLN